MHNLRINIGYSGGYILVLRWRSGEFQIHRDNDVQPLFYIVIMYYNIGGVHQLHPTPDIR